MDEQTSLAYLIAPLPDGPGIDVRASGAGSDLYLSVKDRRGAARLAEREALQSIDPDVDPLEAGARAWGEVASGGATLLSEHAKDLQVAAWVCEAWLRTDGLPGLADGFSLLSELVERYWNDGLYPEADEDGDETRIAPLLGLFGRGDTGTLIQPIKLLPLSDAPGERVALWTIETIRAQAVRHDDPEIREQLTERRAERLASIEGAVAAASLDFYATSVDSIEHALEQLDRLMAAVDARTAFGRFGSQVAQPLQAMLDILRELRAPADQPAEASVPIESFAPTIDDAPASVASTAHGAPAPTRSREAAFATLLEIADFFDRSEPQSLVGKGLRDIVRRAKLPIEELIAELLPEAEQRRLFLLRAGIRDESNLDTSSY